MHEDLDANIRISPKTQAQLLKQAKNEGFEQALRAVLSFAHNTRNADPFVTGMLHRMVELIRETKKEIGE